MPLHMEVAPWRDQALVNEAHLRGVNLDVDTGQHVFLPLFPFPTHFLKATV